MHMEYKTQNYSQPAPSPGLQNPVQTNTFGQVQKSCEAKQEDRRQPPPPPTSLHDPYPAHNRLVIASKSLPQASNLPPMSYFPFHGFDCLSTKSTPSLASKQEGHAQEAYPRAQTYTLKCALPQGYYTISLTKKRAESLNSWTDLNPDPEKAAPGPQLQVAHTGVKIPNKKCPGAGPCSIGPVW
ncbi:hypothetical protein DUNSADRAFT_2794 [Dunaliella salina]|uniref:Encoded protein n=1 Tax=Dunaliella salina TaxID=3046 RepID=A0ABQ7FVW9_DUNSA|nr:hypothetical protein DUNSADRAFT_2794 [Dunaliella salina]|eukprot:KAF5826532.1 hypothetical protein DUNSADRAFT_2794 [Dunaliella salina]